MSFIIGNKCVDCLDTSCVSVCPIDCIHGLDAIYSDEKEAISLGDEVSVHKNYEFFGQFYQKK